ncbi:MAG: hypothetical protein ACP5IA_13020 [Sediminispirochaetaceae bacterium]
MFRIIIHIILLAIVVVFVALNVPYTTSVNLFTYMFEDISTVAVVLVSFIVGIIYSFLIYLQNYFYQSGKKRQKERRDQTRVKEKELKTKEKKIAAPIAAPAKPNASASSKKASKAAAKPGTELSSESGITTQAADLQSKPKKEKKSFLPFGNKGAKDQKKDSKKEP